jgi:hypothetical protein
MSEGIAPSPRTREMGITTSCRARDQSKLRKDGSFLIFLPVSQNRAACGCYQGYAEGNIEDWEGKDQHSNEERGITDTSLAW